MLHRLIRFGLFAFRLRGGAAAALDEPALGEPAGPVILTVTGNVGEAGEERTIRFDRAMLEALGVTTLRTSTAWTAGVSEFEGVLARDLLEAVGAQGSAVIATALNDYITSIPLEELYRYPVLLAFKMDGEYLKIRDKGPLWIIYPRDQFPELKSSMFDKKWVWQLSQLEVQ